MYIIKYLLLAQLWMSIDKTICGTAILVMIKWSVTVTISFRNCDEGNSSPLLAKYTKILLYAFT